ADSLLHSLWCDLEWTDKIAPHVVMGLVRSEIRSGRSAMPWPQTPIGPTRADPDNPLLSLPDSWFTVAALPVVNLFEFPFLQLIRFIDQEPDSTADEFMVAASKNWFGMNRFADAALFLADEAHKHQLLKHHNTTMVHLLEAVRYYFHRISPDERQEMEALLRI